MGTIKGYFLKLSPLLIALLVASAHTAYAQEPVTITGQVVNGTSGSQLPAGLEVRLLVLDGSSTVEDLTVEADASGQFQFQALPHVSDMTYLVAVTYQGVAYDLQVDVDSPSPVQLAVYEATTDISLVHLDTNAVIVRSAGLEGQQLDVLETVKLQNTGDRTFVPGLNEEMPTDFLRFSLPSGYLNLDVQSSLPGGPLLPVDQGFAMITPVPPGTYEVLITYLLPYEGSPLQFARSFPFGMDTFFLLVAEDVGDVMAPGMLRLDPVLMGQVSYSSLEARELEPHATLDIEISGSTGQSLWQRLEGSVGQGRFTPVAISSGVGLVLLALLAYVLFFRRRPATLAGQAVSTEVAVEDRRSLVEAIARLDDLFQRQEIEEEAYRDQRATLKARLLRVALPGMATGSTDAPVEGQPDPPGSPP